MAHDLKALTRRWFDEVWTNGRAEVIDELRGEGVVVRGLSRKAEMDWEGFRRFYDAYRAAFSNIRVVLHQVIAEGDWSAVHMTFHVKHTGDALGFPATGRDASFDATVMIQWKDGRIVGGYNQFDQLGLLRQLGQEGRAVTPE